MYKCVAIQMSMSMSGVIFQGPVHTNGVKMCITYTLIQQIASKI